MVAIRISPWIRYIVHLQHETNIFPFLFPFVTRYPQEDVLLLLLLLLFIINNLSKAQIIFIILHVKFVINCSVWKHRYTENFCIQLWIIIHISDWLTDWQLTFSSFTVKFRELSFLGFAHGISFCGSWNLSVTWQSLLY
jgi:hypothetical protein